MTDIDIEGLEELAEFEADLLEAADEIEVAIDSAVEKTALRVERTAKTRVPVDTNTLRPSIEQRRLGLAEHVVGTPVEYGPDVEYGTRPHVITPDTADALAFRGEDGELVFRPRVEHPGTPAQPYLRPALEAHRSDLVQNIREAIDDLLTETFQ